MVYPNIKLDDFKRKYLELSVWSFSIYTPHIFLGQVVIDLSGIQEFLLYSIIKSFNYSFENIHNFKLNST